MSNTKMGSVDTSQNAVKKPAIFGSAVDLAHIVNKEWAFNNLDLTSKTDKVLLFVYKEIATKDVSKNFFQKFIFKVKVKKSRKVLNLFIKELRGLVNEVDALISFNTYLRSGTKSKIKNRKVFDDFITERREIAIMLQGLLLFLETDTTKDFDFSNEISILDEVQKEVRKFESYFMMTCAFLVTFEF